MQIATLLPVDCLLEPNLPGRVDDGHDQLAGPQLIGFFSEAVMAQRMRIAGDHPRVGDGGLPESEGERRPTDFLPFFVTRYFPP